MAVFKQICNVKVNDKILENQNYIGEKNAEKMIVKKLKINLALLRKMAYNVNKGWQK